MFFVERWMHGCIHRWKCVCARWSRLAKSHPNTPLWFYYEWLRWKWEPKVRSTFFPLMNSFIVVCIQPSSFLTDLEHIPLTQCSLELHMTFLRFSCSEDCAGKWCHFNNTPVNMSLIAAYVVLIFLTYGTFAVHGEGIICLDYNIRRTHFEDS